MKARQTFWYKDKPYKIVMESQIKDTTLGWTPCIIYEALYKREDGKTIFVRYKDDFFKKFKPK